MVIPALIEAIAPNISDAALQQAVDFAINVMRQTRDTYREPVSLLDVARTDKHILSFTVRALYTHNTSTYELDLPTEAFGEAE